MNFKKHIATLLSALILFSGIGLAINVHYCGGKVSSVGLTYKIQELCGVATKKKSCCGSETSTHKKCCKDSLIKINKHGENVLVKSLHLDLAAFAFVPAECFAFSAQTEAIYARQLPAVHADPHAPPLYKLYCQLVYYA